jgi:chromosomal replication initiation ATPase DnaA
MGDFPTLPAIMDAVEIEYDLPRGTLTTPLTFRRIHEAPQLGMYLARTMPPNNRAKRSLTEIGRAMGSRDHTTILNGIERTTERLVDDVDFQKTVARIRTGLCEPVT